MTTETRPRVLTGKHFMNGDTACAEGAMAAGCDFFAGYPITPSTEVAERLAIRLPEVGGKFILMEDELGSMAAVLGGAWAGARAMTATSGPGFTLMMENIGLGVMTETPCVVIDVQRGSPSTGLPTLVGQSDIMQAKWGSHGDYQIVAYCPSSCQEMFDFTIKAFNTADRYRVPVFVLADEVIGHLTEGVVIPEDDDIERVPVRRPTEPPNDDYLVYQPGDDLVPPMPRAGDGYRMHITGLTHDERGYPAMEPATHEKLVRRLNDKILTHADDIIEYEETMVDDADIVVVAYGSVARSAREAVVQARKLGIAAGLLRPITIWPFMSQRIIELDARVRGFVVAELNLGQVAGEISRYTSRPIRQVNLAGGELLPPGSIVEAIQEAAG